MTQLHEIFYYCTLCLHLSNLGFEGIVDQLNFTCNFCINYLVSEPHIQRNLHFPENFSQQGEIPFDYRLLPLLRKAIEEEIEYAHEMTGPENRFLSGGLDIIGHNLADFRVKFSNLFRELYAYERDVKAVYEKQKSEILQKLDQKADDFLKESMTNLLEKDVGFEKRNEKMNRIVETVRFKQREAKNSIEDLARNEMMQIIEPYSIMIKNTYDRMEKFRSFRPGENNSFMDLYSLVDDSLNIFESNIALGKVPDESPRFQEAFQKFNVTLEIEKLST